MIGGMRWETWDRQAGQYMLIDKPLPTCFCYQGWWHVDLKEGHRRGKETVDELFTNNRALLHVDDYPAGSLDGCLMRKGRVFGFEFTLWRGK